jgi:hypothetical protein
MVNHFGATSIPGVNAFIGSRPVDQAVVENHLRKTIGITKREPAAV